MRQPNEMQIFATLVLSLVMTGVGAELEPDAWSQTKTGAVRKVDVAAKSLVVMVNREMTFGVTDATVIREGSRPRTLADIQVGATVRVTYFFAAGRNRVASNVTIVPPVPIASPTTEAGTDVLVRFTLNTTDAHGAPLQQQRFYWVYRPANLPRSTPAPIILAMDGGKPSLFHRKADEAGFVAVSCSFSGNATGTPGRVWNNDNPRVSGNEDYDYVTEVIHRVRAAENGSGAFVVGLSKGGHMSLAYACERPSMIRAAASVDEFMGLASNFPTAPVPMILFQGTSDTNVPYTMVKDTVDAWRAVNGLLNMPPVTTYEPSPRFPGRVSQATWRGGIADTQVAFVTIVGGSHRYPQPGIETGYDVTDGLWAFFSQFLTGRQGPPTIVSQPPDNVQPVGQPASFRVVATGSDPLKYQWQRNGQDIPGATESRLTIATVSPDDHGAKFQAIVSNSEGRVTSDAATLSVTAAPAGPTISVHPQSRTVKAGQSATFTASATGTGPLRYQWRRNGVDILGATSATHTLSTTTTFDAGASVRVLVSNGTGTVVSTPATLSVMRPPGVPIMLANPVRERVLEGQSAGFSVAAWSASPMQYQWQQGSFTGHMVDIPGATDATYRTSPATLADHLTLFRCLVSNATGSTASGSEMLFVTADPKRPTDITSAIAVTGQVGKPFRYEITSSGGTKPITYSARPLPLGLSLDADSGRITGTPNSAGSTNIVISASNSAGSTSTTLVFMATDTPPLISMDAWRTAHFGASATNPAIAGDAADPDGDGHSNIDEFSHNSNPLDQE